MKIPPEKRLYPTVEKWLKRHFRCFTTKTDTGVHPFSRADIIGVRDIGGDLCGDVETIIVEVKRGLDPFATASGQTLGYSVYANRVYLADRREKGFTLDELQIASYLRIGLIQIWKGKCVEVLSSPFFHPINRMNLLMLEKLHLGKCQLCGTFFVIGEEKHGWSKVARGGALKALRAEKGLMFWNDELAERKNRMRIRPTEDGCGYERRFICPDCMAQLISVEEKRIKGWLAEYQPAEAQARHPSSLRRSSVKR